MEPLIRQYRGSDEECVVELSLRAWEPVFASMRAQLGDSVFGFLYPDWREAQASAVRAVLDDKGNRVWVAAVRAQAVGFVAAKANPDDGEGSIEMLAVDPPQQRQGVGLRLTTMATDWLRDEGVRLAVVETGGDVGHAPARHTYESAGYVPMPIARYFKLLDVPAASAFEIGTDEPSRPDRTESDA